MVSLVFGSPGSGKTTYACYLFHKDQKKIRKFLKRRRSSRAQITAKQMKKYGLHKHYFANFPNKLSTVFKDTLKLGEFTLPQNSLLICDEAGIEFNNRGFKSFPKPLISWLKLHRHYKVDCCFISQSWEDCDITIRRLADELWYLRKLGPFTLARRVKRFVDINDDSQIIDGFVFRKLIYKLLPPPFHQDSFRIIFRPFYYKYFDTYEAPELPLYNTLK